MLEWLEDIKEMKVSFINTDKVISDIKSADRLRLKYKNFIEAAIAAMIIDNFKHCGVEGSQITVITPFLEQQILLENHLKNYKVSSVLTIDKA
jgi:superfamily I DNA and/or RNA helicase